jgi:D-sorbitol dehydrogenase (acceptor)
MEMLTAKRAVITGGGQGIGKAIALRFAAEGATVVVADLSLDNAEAVAAEIESLHGQAIAVAVDVRDESQVQKMIDLTREAFGGLDILVNNAGLGRFGPFLDVTEADWDFMFDVNCKGLLWCSQAGARAMIEQGTGGKIINIASQAGRRGEALALAYCASKACVISMTQSIALALAPYGINVNAVAPGVVDTPFWEDVDRQFAKLGNLPVGEPKRQAVAAIPLGRIERPEDVAGAAVFLASADGDYITQQCFNVDGGNWPS